MLTKLLIAIIAFSGLLIGYLLTFLVKEEIKPGQKYFLWLERILRLAIIAVLLWVVATPKAMLLPFIIGIIIGLFLKIRYFYLGLVLAAASSLPMNLFVVVAALVFVYGFPYGSISSKLKLPFHALLFFIPVLVMLFFNPINTESMLAFVAGALVLQK